jgi:hypothetical protein
MSRTTHRVVRVKPRHINAIPYNRSEKHRPAYGNFTNADYEENRW